MSEWKRVEDGLPEDFISVLTVNAKISGHITMRRLVGTSPRVWFDGFNETGIKSVTHWMPLPEPPKDNQ